MKKQHVHLLLFLLTIAHARAQSSGDIIITEFMPDPVKVADASGEWIELCNTTDHAIDINKWQLKDGASKKHNIAAKMALPVKPHQFLFLALKGDSTVNGGLHPDYVYSNFSLPNTTGKLLLTDSAGVIIDSVRYSNVVAGKAWSLDPLYFSGKGNDDADHWCSATTPYGNGDYGTPRYSNTTCMMNAINDEHITSAAEVQLIHDELRITWAAVPDEQPWAIWNYCGQLMQSGRLASQSKIFSIQLNEFHKGVYILRLYTTGTAIKFIVP